MLKFLSLMIAVLTFCDFQLLNVDVKVVKVDNPLALGSSQTLRGQVLDARASASLGFAKIQRHPNMR